MVLKNYTHITLLVDRSGSMGRIQADAEGGINEFIKKNKKASGDCTFALYQFDTEYEHVFGPADISKMKEYTLSPRGGTALLDAQWQAIAETGEYLAAMPESQRPSKVIFLTVTDGEENSSKELTGPAGWKKLKDKVLEQRTSYDWDFAYIGADQDAFAVGHAMGYASTTSYAGTGASAKAMYASTTDTVLRSRATGESLASAGLASDIDEDGNIISSSGTNTPKPAAKSTSKDKKKDK